jgi:hypothetical protein
MFGKLFKYFNPSAIVPKKATSTDSKYHYRFLILTMLVWNLKHLHPTPWKEKELFTFNNPANLAKWKVHSDKEFGGIISCAIIFTS